MVNAPHFFTVTMFPVVCLVMRNSHGTRDCYVGVLEKVGVWSPYHELNKDLGSGKFVYNVYRTLIIGFCALHTFTECFLICFDFRNLSLDELTVTIAYGIQHFLGIVKVYIIISQQQTILDLDRRTKEWPLYREDPKFIAAVNKTAKLSDRIGYVYWFFVLITISCGCVTGLYETTKNKNEMKTVCNEKLQYYGSYFIEHNMVQPVFNNEEDYVKVGLIENELKLLNKSLPATYPDCARPKRAFPYHVWMPFDAKKSPYFQVIFVLNFLAGFGLVCCILPIDLLVMSFTRYICFQFGVLKQDLINLREICKEDLKMNIKSIPTDAYDELLTDVTVKRLRRIIAHHEAIFHFFNKTNDLFTWVLFAQYVGSAVMICGVLYQLSTVVDDLLTPKTLHVGFFYSGLLFQLYSNCYYGSQVFVLSIGIAEFAYVSGWHESGRHSFKLKPYIKMIMNRSIRPCKLTAGKFAAVDLPTFMNVFKASYTYYTVLVDDGTKYK